MRLRQREPDKLGGCKRQFVGIVAKRERLRAVVERHPDLGDGGKDCRRQRCDARGDNASSCLCEIARMRHAGTDGPKLRMLMDAHVATRPAHKWLGAVADITAI